jgi:hypothetical protein
VGTALPFANNQIPRACRAQWRGISNDQSLYPLPLIPDLRFNQLNASSSQLNLDQGDISMDAKPSNK